MIEFPKEIAVRENGYELRIVVEKVAVSSQQVVNRDTLKIYDVKAPASILS